MLRKEHINHENTRIALHRHFIRSGRSLHLACLVGLSAAFEDGNPVPQAIPQVHAGGLVLIPLYSDNLLIQLSEVHPRQS
jgi:hypothetical protein